MFVVMRVQSWDFKLSSNFPYPISIDTSNEISIGYLPVYDTLEDLHKDFPGETNYVEVVPIEN